MTNFKTDKNHIGRIDNGRSWIVQRLLKPKNDTPNPYTSTLYDFSNEDTIKAINDVFKIDYMGAFEYESGALPKSMARMYDIGILLFKPYITDEFKIWMVCSMDASEMTIGEMKTREKRICQFIWDAYENGIIDEVAKNDNGSFYKVINGQWYNDNLCGWYDLQNDFAYFTDEKMARGFYRLFTDE